VRQHPDGATGFLAPEKAKDRQVLYRWGSNNQRRLVRVRVRVPLRCVRVPLVVGGTGNALTVLRSNKRCLDIFSIQDKRVPIAEGIIIGVGVGIGIGIEGQKAGFGPAKPDVSRTSIAYVGWPIVTVREDQPQYTVGIDPDPDSDPDTDGNQEQTDRQQPNQAAAKPRLSQTMKKCPNHRGRFANRPYSAANNILLN
jgi:hypothetical protein